MQVFRDNTCQKLPHLMAIKRWDNDCPLCYLKFNRFCTKLFTHKSAIQALVHFHLRSYSTEEKFVHASLPIS